MKLDGMEAAMYLRKSRAEDGQDTEEILRRHRETLTEYADQNGIHVMEIFQEVKSGESLYTRPEMMRLLEAMEAGQFDAVLCMDLDRLSRGGTRERGIVWEAFKASETIIATPSKVYDLNAESDEMLVEFRGLFANMELRQIKKRLRRGMLRAAKEGCHLSYAPYGYRKLVVDRRHTLEIYEPEARFVRMAFEWYVQGDGCDTIARRLTELGAHPRRAVAFTRTTILKMIKNPVYIGKIVYNREKWSRKHGKINVEIRPEAEWVYVDGLHPAIVSLETFTRCQDILKTRWRPAYFDGNLKTSLAGLIRCRNCGGRMQRRAIDGRDYIHCLKRGCCTGVRYDAVEVRVIASLKDTLHRMEVEPGREDAKKQEAAKEQLQAIRDALAAENRKKALLYEFLEDGTYSKEEFRTRMDAVKERIASLERQEADGVAGLEALTYVNEEQRAQNIRDVLEMYWDVDAAERNFLLKGVIKVIWYDRPKGSADFALDVFLV